MADEKKFYWLKLDKDFFKNHKIKVVESLPNGKDYILFYLKMLCESISHEGALRFSDTIPYNEDMLSSITNTNVDVVRSAIKLFSELELMEIWDDGTYFMAECQKMIGSETNWAVKKREYRERLKQIGQCPQDVQPMSDKSIENRDKILDNRDNNNKKEIIKEKYGEFNNVSLSDEELEKLKEKFPKDYQNRIEKLSAYIASTGKKYKSHYATILNWSRKEESNKPQSTFNKTYTTADYEECDF